MNFYINECKHSQPQMMRSDLRISLTPPNLCSFCKLSENYSNILFFFRKRGAALHSLGFDSFQNSLASVAIELHWKVPSKIILFIFLLFHSIIDRCVFRVAAKCSRNRPETQQSLPYHFGFWLHKSFKIESHRQVNIRVSFFLHNFM